MIQPALYGLKSTCGCFPRIVFIWFVAAIIFTPTASSCADTKLTRSKAGELIKRSKQFKDTYVFKFLCLGDCTYPQLDNPNDESLGPQADYRIVTALESLGYVQIKVRNTFRPPAGGQVYNLHVSLTEKGKTASQGWQKANPATFMMPVAHKELVEVTGIQILEQQKTAITEYTWKWSPDGVGKELIAAGIGIMHVVPAREQKIHKDETALKLYDDGWRVAQ